MKGHNFGWCRKCGKIHSHPMFGKHHTEESKLKNRNSHFGRPVWNKGKKLPQFSRENNGMWKGDSAQSQSFHHYLRAIKPTSSVCQLCLGNTCDNKKPFELANIKNHQYTRNPEDYRWASHLCHMKFDGTNKTFLGRHHTEESKMRISQTKRARNRSVNS